MIWQPIETAPVQAFNKEEWFMPHSPRLLLWACRATIGYYSFTEKGKCGWHDFRGTIAPTHWMPLPDAPETNQPKGNEHEC